jgi:hypothetical protein
MKFIGFIENFISFQKKYILLYICSIREQQFLHSKHFFSKKITLPIKSYEYFSKKKVRFFLLGS